MTVKSQHIPSLFPPGVESKVRIHYQLAPKALIQQTLERGEGELSDTGALCISTGEFTGRSPKDKFILRDTVTASVIDWNGYNLPIDEASFQRLKDKMLQYLALKEDIWIRDVIAGSHPAYRLTIRIVNEQPAANLFCYNLFLRPDEEALPIHAPDWEIIHLPGFEADPATDGTRTEHFALISFAHKSILIGGTGYTGEIKKSVFTILNYLFPHDKGVLTMHCSVNVGKDDGDAALFFGLSGTGKTTLSTDPHRKLVGDDEHGWTKDGLFNLEGGCYAKIIDLSAEKEPAIYGAVRDGALVENTTFQKGTRSIDFVSTRITENTRVSYPLHYIPDAVIPSVCGSPKHIFFLTCDAFGVLPPLSRLTTEQALFYFISGYTAKVAGTESGIREPKATFSACFGAPFLPLHPTKYASLLRRKLIQEDITVWMVNTGWTGGGYGVGRRIHLKDSRAMITAVVNVALKYVHFIQEEIFGLWIPKRCPGVDSHVLLPRHTWKDGAAYERAARHLAQLFIENFDQYTEVAGEEIRAAGPQAKQVSKNVTA